MEKLRNLLTALILLALCFQICAQKPRIINMTDLGADPDDEQSMVRFLVQSNEFDVEGLIVTTGCWKKSQSGTSMLDKIINAYGQAVSNLKVHDPEFPSLSYLQSVSKLGQRGYGMNDVGSGKDSPGSELVISVVDKDDPRPVWICFWGGGNTLAQALWKVQNTRSAVELKKFISKIRVYDVLGQDNAGTWIAKNFPDIIYIRATSVYNWQPSDSWIDNNVQGHGPLGAVYPDRRYATEGDSPSFLHVLPNGLNNPDEVWQGSWGGRFGRDKKTGIRGMSCMSGEDKAYDPYYMYGNVGDNSRWKNAIHNDFEARMDWSVSSNYLNVNHHPVAVVNGDVTKQVLEISTTPGSTVNLNAAGSSDPDNNSLTYKWFYYREAGTYTGSVSVSGSSTATPAIQVPSDALDKEIHIVLELRDNGSPNLYAYRRVILNVTGSMHNLKTSVIGQGEISPSSGAYAAGSVITLTATGKTGWAFDHWSGDVSGTANPVTITMNRDKSVTAHFLQVSTFKLTSTVTGQGSINPGSGTFTQGEVVSITATPDAGWRFDGWGGDASGTENPLLLTMDANKNIAATFVVAPVTGVRVSPTTATVGIGGSTQLTATVEPSGATNKNVSWSSNNTSVATVSSSGVVTGVSKGSAVITVKTQDGGYTASCQITVSGGSSYCNNPKAISIPFVKEGAGDFCWSTTKGIAYINSWNLEELTINGVDYTNTWSNNLPPAQNGQWTIHYVGKYNWSHFEAAATKNSVSLASGIEKGIRIYPNPFKDGLNIDLSRSEGAKRIEVINSLGQVVEAVNAEQAQEGLINLEIGTGPGLYLIRIYNRENIVSKLIVKE